MKNWLTKIKTYICSLRVSMMDTRKRARVIRELVRLVKMFHAFSSVPQINLQKAVDISDDTKALLK